MFHANVSFRRVILLHVWFVGEHIQYNVRKNLKKTLLILHTEIETRITAKP